MLKYTGLVQILRFYSKAQAAYSCIQDVVDKSPGNRSIMAAAAAQSQEEEQKRHGNDVQDVQQQGSSPSTARVPIEVGRINKIRVQVLIYRN